MADIRPENDNRIGRGRPTAPKPSVARRTVLCAICVALCVALPLALHAIPNAAVMLSPMHIPVLLCGLVCGWSFGLLCGLIGPLLSSLLTGMPMAAILPAMMIELAAYGLISGLLIKIVRTGRPVPDVYATLLCAMFGGRVVAGIARALLFSPGGYSLAAWASVYFVTALPGIALQLLLIPAVYFALERAHIVPARYNAE